MTQTVDILNSKKAKEFFELAGIMIDSNDSAINKVKLVYIESGTVLEVWAGLCKYSIPYMYINEDEEI